MVAATHQQSGIQALVKHAVTARQLSRHEHLRLTSAMLSDPSLPAADRFHINRLLDYVRAGKISLVD
ncbi:MAG: hypothetical protein AAGG53_10165 [Cyanobacteria bacterium P01_H01_bin.152]